MGLPKIKDVLQKDFVKEVKTLWSEAEDILEETIDAETFISKVIRPGDSFSFYSLPLYVVCRIIKPETVIETGTQNGGSAQAILSALRRNKKGLLHSIDSGAVSTDGTHKDTHGIPGSAITTHLKQRWELHLGLSSEELPKLLMGIDKVDLFFHDSDHSKACVEFEFREIMKKCVPGSLVGLHDHYGQWNDAEILSCFRQIIGCSRPSIHCSNGIYHNVLRLWRL